MVCRGRAVRFEKRAGECTGVASLRGSTPEAQGNRHARSPLRARGGVLMGPESHPYDPKPGDLGRGRVKPPIRGVEARRGVTVQSAPLTPV